MGISKIIEILLKFGSNIEEKDDFNRTPILLTESHLNLDSIEILFRYGANLNDKYNILFFILKINEIFFLKFLEKIYYLSQLKEIILKFQNF